MNVWKCGTRNAENAKDQQVAPSGFGMSKAWRKAVAQAECVSALFGVSFF
jgi:hypothetical protein